MRARNIKPGFFRNEQLMQVPPLGRLLFAGLWCLADREGRLIDRPMQIKWDVLPADDCDVDALLDELAARGFVRRYTVDGGRYLEVVNFLRHQRPHYKEAAGSLPPPTISPTQNSPSTRLIPDCGYSDCGYSDRGYLPDAERTDAYRLGKAIADAGTADAYRQGKAIADAGTADAYRQGKPTADAGTVDAYRLGKATADTGTADTHRQGKATADTGTADTHRLGKATADTSRTDAYRLGRGAPDISSVSVAACTTPSATEIQATSHRIADLWQQLSGKKVTRPAMRLIERALTDGYEENTLCELLRAKNLEYATTRARKHFTLTNLLSDKLPHHLTAIGKTAPTDDRTDARADAPTDVRADARDWTDGFFAE